MSLLEVSQQWRFWAFIPGDPIQSEITAFKSESASLLGSSKALRSPAHITVIPPIRLVPEEAVAVDALVRAFNERQDPFPIICSGFSSFPNRVLFVQVNQDGPIVSYADGLCSLLRSQMTQIKWGNTPYLPHITIAFRDLSPYAFEIGKDLFLKRTYYRVWIPKGLWRLDLVDEGWKPEVFLPFSGSGSSQDDPKNQPASKQSL